MLEQHDTVSLDATIDSSESVVACLSEIFSGKNQTITKLFEAQVHKTPHAIALRYGDQQLSYSQLNTRINYLTVILGRQGVTRQTRVALFLERGFDLIIAMLATIKAGAIYIPVDINYPTDRIEFMLKNCACQCIITNNKLSDKLSSNNLCEKILLDSVTDLGTTFSDNPPNISKPDDLLYIMYTSGSTGRPKGIETTHQNLIQLFLSAYPFFSFTKDDVWLQFHSSSFDVSVWEIFGALLYGGTLVLIPEIVTKDIDLFYNLLVENQITILNETPTAFYKLIEICQLKQNTASHLSELRLIILVGESLKLNLLPAWFDLFPVKGPRLFNMYGVTEATILSTKKLISHQDALLAKSNCIGTPLPGMHAYIVDHQNNLVADGKVGELCFSGPMVGRGYHCRPDMTAVKFIKNPFSESHQHATLYKTGDLARMNETREIEYVERLDTQVKIRGFRVDLGEIEAILQQLDSIKLAIVLKKELPTRTPVLIAYLKHKDHTPKLSTQELRDFVLSKLPDYMCPVIFEWVLDFPLTINGKLNRDALPDIKLETLQAEYIVPRNEIEAMLCEAWKQVFGLTRIGIKDDFFALGGDSIVAIQIALKVRARGFFIQSSWLFETPNIAQLTPRCTLFQEKSLPISILPDYSTLLPILEQKKNIPQTAIEAIYPVTPMQAGILFHCQDNSQAGTYINQVWFNLKGILNRDALKQTWQMLVNNNTILRTAFLLDLMDEPLQVVMKKCVCLLEDANLESLSPVEQKEFIDKKMQQVRMQGFELIHPPLFKIHLFQLSSQEFTLVYTDHHLISDRISLTALFKEFFLLYENTSQDNAIVQRSAPAFVDYVAWLRQQDISNAKTYWKQHLSRFESPTQLWIETPTTQRNKGQYAWYTHHFNDALTEKLTTFSRQHGLTFNTLFQAAWGLLLCRYSGQNSVVFGIVESGRNIIFPHIMERLGIFINTFPIMIEINAQLTGNELLFASQQQVLDSSKHALCSLSEIIRQTGYSLTFPLFNTVLGYQHHPIEELPLALNKDYPLNISNIESFAQTHYPLTVMLYDKYARLCFDTSHFSHEVILQMANHWETLLEGLVRYPNQPVVQLPLLSQQEKHAFSLLSKPAEFAYPANTIHEWFECQAAKTPENIALSFCDKKMTYFELNTQANQLAHFLRKHQVHAEKVIAVYLKRGFDLIIAILATIKAGAAYLPIDATLPIKKVLFMLKDSQASGLITHTSLYTPLIENPDDHSSIPPAYCIDTISHIISKQAQHNLISTTQIDNLLYTIYTSGSTGTPKGVMITHRSLLHLFATTQSCFQLSSQDVWTQFHSISFDFAVWEIFGALLYGGKLVLISDCSTLDLEDFYHIVVKNKITILNQTPSVFYGLNSAAESYLSDPQSAPYSLRMLILGGEALNLTRLKKWFENPYCSHIQLVNTYGITETTVHLTYQPLQASLINQSPYTSIGLPFPGIQMCVLDQYEQLVPPGTAGELYIAGTAIAKGYIHHPELTASAFITITWDNGENRWYKSGDLVRWLSEGKLEYIARKDEQVKIRGFRVDLKEIEQEILKFPFINHATVLFQTQNNNSLNEKALVAYLIPHNIKPKIQEYNDLELEVIHDWQEVYEQLYKATPTLNVQFDTSGWYNSLNNHTYNLTEMHEWQNNIVARILSYHPKEILEIGFGTGLLLFPLISKCSRYIGTDFSLTALKRIQSGLNIHPDQHKVQLFHQCAHELVADDFLFDTVIINSVIQYFPSKNYLEQVIEQALAQTLPGGQIIIGDVRNLNWQTYLQLMKLLYHGKIEISALSSLQLNLIEQAHMAEEELLVAPAFFKEFATRHPRITSIEIQSKNGSCFTEMNAFRYDVILHIEKPICDNSSIHWIEFKSITPIIDIMATYLNPELTYPIGFKQVSNAHVFWLDKLLNNSLQQEEYSSSIPRKNHQSAYYPYDFLELAKENNLSVYITPSEVHAAKLDIIFYPSCIPAYQIANMVNDSSHQQQSFNPSLNGVETVSSPLIYRQQQKWSQYLIKQLKKQFSAHMIPQKYIFLSQLPHTRNGKLNKEALSLLIPSSTKAGRYIPTDQIEHDMLQIWQSILGTEDIRAQENFFDMGGHSLSAIQLIGKIRQHFNITIKLQDLMIHSNIDSLTSWLRQS